MNRSKCAGRLLMTLVCFALLCPSVSLAQAPAAQGRIEEFNGPYPSWKNLKDDYGAVGNNVEDDTAAIQKALDELTKHEKLCVLYIPAGTYRITRTITTVRKQHTDCQGVTIVGEDPATTTLRWDGPAGGTLMQWDAWYSKISRLTFDGKGSGNHRAGTLLSYGPAFSTYNETSDIIFRDAGNGLVFGHDKSAGQAENEVLRCQFLRCDTGLQTVNWNSMDIWVWYCRFEDCDRGVHNQMGNWHVWQSLFLRSKTSDLSAANLMVFSAVNNVSIGSACFLNFDNGHTWGSPMSITGNRVLDPTGAHAIRLGNAGPYLLADNVLRVGPNTRAIKMCWGDQILIGNTYSRQKDVVEENGRFRRIGEKFVEPATIPDELPVLPTTPPRVGWRVVEVRAGATADTIQTAIHQCLDTDPSIPSAPLTRAIVHLPMGTYKIDKTIVVPAQMQVHIVGDGAGETATRLEWTGPPDGVMFRFDGPSQALMRDVYLHVPQGRAIEVTNIDHPRGRVFADQLNVTAPAAPAGKTLDGVAALRINKVESSSVLLRALQGSGNGGAWVDVIGGGGDRRDQPALRVPNQISIFTGATGSAAGQYRVRENGTLVVRGVYHERSTDALSGLQLTGAGQLSIDATRFSYATSPEKPTIGLHDFQGTFTLATSLLTPVETKTTCRIETIGDCSKASVLALGNHFWVEQPPIGTDVVWQNKGRAAGGLIASSANGNNKEALPQGMAFIPNIGDAPNAGAGGPALRDLAKDSPGVSDETIVRHLHALRTARVWSDADPPDGEPDATNVRFHRVMVISGGVPQGGAVVEFRGD